MRKLMVSCVVLGLAVGLWGCDDRGHEAGVAAVKPPAHSGEFQAGEFHNDVMLAFERRAPLSSIPSMQWDEWLETTLNSMEEVCVARDIPFDREETSRHIVELAAVFGKLKETTGIDPGMLRESATPEADLKILVGQLRDWKAIDAKTAEAVSQFDVTHAAERARSIEDPGLHELFDIGVASKEFWTSYEKRTPVVRSDEDPPCKSCFRGATLSDFIGGLIGRIVCGHDPICVSTLAAAASLIFVDDSGYYGPVGIWPPGWWPPNLP
jgi:hypothetical protein